MYVCILPTKRDRQTHTDRQTVERKTHIRLEVEVEVEGGFERERRRVRMRTGMGMCGRVGVRVRQGTRRRLDDMTEGRRQTVDRRGSVVSDRIA